MAYIGRRMGRRCERWGRTRRGRRKGAGVLTKIFLVGCRPCVNLSKALFVAGEVTFRGHILPKFLKETLEIAANMIHKSESISRPDKVTG